MKNPLRYVLPAVLLSISCGLIPSISSITGSGNVITVDPNLEDFDHVELSYQFRAEIVQGRRFQIVIRIDDNLEDELDVRVVGRTLRVGLQPNRSYSFERVTLEATITMPELHGLKLDGASRAELAGFSSIEDLTLDLSGASQVLGNIDTGDLAIDVSGASLVRLSGEGQNLSVDASGASTIDLEDFLVHDVDGSLSGASDLIVNLDGTLNANLSGASSLIYSGDPQLGDIDTSGASSIEGR